MIEISVCQGAITVVGHAGYAPAGLDIVCASVSLLIQTLIKSIEDLTKDEIEYEILSGRADINFGSLSEKSKTLMDSFLIGIRMVADEYPDHVSVSSSWRTLKAT